MDNLQTTAHKARHDQNGQMRLAFGIGLGIDVRVPLRKAGADCFGGAAAG